MWEIAAQRLYFLMNEEVDRGRRLRNPGYVYILQSGRLLKIGQSAKPNDRVENLNRNAYFGRNNWEILDVFKTDWMLQAEQISHMELIDFNVRNEVFDCSHERAKSVIITSINHLNKRFKG